MVAIYGDGVPNKYGSKIEMLLIAAFATIFPALNAVFAVKFGRYDRRLTVFLGVVFLLAVGLIGLVVNQIIRANIERTTRAMDCPHYVGELA